MFNLFLVDAALETVPKQLWNHPSVAKRAKTLGKKPSEMLLDRTYHHRAMLRLENNEQRGRPDIIHFALLEALGSPLNKEGMLRVYVHTINGQIICVNPKVRLPRNYDRFVGLIEQLFSEGKVPVTDQPLLELSKENIKQILAEVNPSYIIAFTRNGEAKTLEAAMKTLQTLEQPAAFIGAFPHGHFSNEIAKLADTSISIDPESLEAWTVTSRVIYEFEKLVMLPEMRWSKIS